MLSLIAYVIISLRVHKIALTSVFSNYFCWILGVQFSTLFFKICMVLLIYAENLMQMLLLYDCSERVAFLCRIASIAKQESFGRAGLMALAACIASASFGTRTYCECEAQWCENSSPDTVEEETAQDKHKRSADLLDTLRVVVENSKQHFNANYRLRGL